MITDILKQLEGELVENRNYFIYEVPHIIDGIFKASKNDLEFFITLKILGFNYNYNQFVLIVQGLNNNKDFATVIQEHQNFVI